MILHETKNFVFTGHWEYRPNGVPKCIEVNRQHRSLWSHAAPHYLGLFESEAAARAAIEHHVITEGLE